MVQQYPPNLAGISHKHLQFVGVCRALDMQPLRHTRLTWLASTAATPVPTSQNHMAVKAQYNRAYLEEAKNFAQGVKFPAAAGAASSSSSAAGGSPRCKLNTLGMQKLLFRKLFHKSFQRPARLP